MTAGRDVPMNSTPIAFFIFNRPDKTARVFEAIREARPWQLFIIADGPRNEDERDRCNAARAVTEQVDWPCEVRRDYAPTNKGCDERIPSGISWVLNQVDRAIILEDDCLPHTDFFDFCDELLERYSQDERVMHISGTNFQHGNRGFKCAESYYFSTIPQTQGWATWRRAWKLFDPSLRELPEIEKSGLLSEIFRDPAVRDHWSYKFNLFRNQILTNWDGRWAFACASHRGYSIVPRVNLISNIGYGPDATHTKNIRSGKANIPVRSIGFPLIHPTTIMPNENADAYEAKYYRGINLRLYQRVVWFSKSHFPKTHRLAKRIFKES
jgi:hypothetical protein